MGATSQKSSRGEEAVIQAINNEKKPRRQTIGGFILEEAREGAQMMVKEP